MEVARREEASSGRASLEEAGKYGWQVILGKEGKLSLPVQASFIIIITCLDRRVGIASSMTGQSEDHSVNNLVSTFMIRLHTINLKHCKLLPLSSR